MDNAAGQEPGTLNDLAHYIFCTLDPTLQIATTDTI